MRSLIKSKILIRSLLLALMCFSLAACFTLGSSDVKPVAGQNDTYKLVVYVTLECSSTCSEGKANTEFTKYMTANGYKSYEILNREHTIVPFTSYTYTAKFAR